MKASMLVKILKKSIEMGGDREVEFIDFDGFHRQIRTVDFPNEKVSDGNVELSSDSE